MARTTITLDSTSINTGNYKTKTIQHDSSAPVDINALSLTRQDGRKIISTNHDWKEITLEGNCTGTDQATFETNLDALKLLFNVSNGTLDIAYGGDTRRYYVCLQSFITRRNHYNTTYANWTVTFVAHKGVGEATAVTEALSAVALDDTTTSWEDVNFGGTATPKPTITYVIDTAGNLATITETNDTTGSQISIGTAWADSDVLVVDTDNKTVKLNNQDVDFEGVFPKFIVGDNDLTTGFGIAGNLKVEQSLTDGTSDTIYSPNNWTAQSFDPGANYNIESIEVVLSSDKVISPILRVETDNAGKPSGTLVHANATSTLFVIAGLSGVWYKFSYTAFAVSTGTTYWLVINDGGSISNNLKAKMTTTNPYANGNLAKTVDGGSNWTDEASNDLAFKVYSDSVPSYLVDKKVSYTKRYL